MRCAPRRLSFAADDRAEEAIMTIPQVAPELEWAAGWSAHDADRVVRLFTDDCVYEDVTIGAVNRGKDELRAFAAAIFAAIPDFAIQLSSSHADERWAAMEWTMSGTHAADLPGLPATGERFSVRGATVLELGPEGISRCTDYWDKATFAAQVGLDGAPAAADQATAKMIFVLQRRAGITREQCLEYWSGQHHTQLVGRLPGLTRWRQNHVVSAPGEPACDGIGELWFESDEALEAALGSPEMAAAVEDATNFLDMDRTGLVIVDEKTPIG
jgi:steroid delta-isomerase-like uncharacterized protein/uncharacterized protein (TIGR02118 family)